MISLDMNTALVYHNITFRTNLANFRSHLLGIIISRDNNIHIAFYSSNNSQNLRFVVPIFYKSVKHRKQEPVYTGRFFPGKVLVT